MTATWNSPLNLLLTAAQYVWKATRFVFALALVACFFVLQASFFLGGIIFGALLIYAYFSILVGLAACWFAVWVAFQMGKPKSR